MDYGFMTSMFRSEYMPGFFGFCSNLNYYYVGQFLATYLTKLSLYQYPMLQSNAHDDCGLCLCIALFHGL